MKPHEDWLIKAEHDLKSAKKLFGGDDPINDTALYHTQQCAEKALKAYIAFNDKPIEKTHDIQLLLELCIEMDEEFDNLYRNGISLNPYSTIFRYPGPASEPDSDDVKNAIEIAEKIMDFVLMKITGL